MKRIFKIRASQIGRIMGDMGLTAKQKEYLLTLESREKNSAIDTTVKPLTQKMQEDLADLRKKNLSQILPDTCTSYLKEWYANENQSLHSKYIDKGIMCEHEAIEYMAEMLEFGIAEKNVEQAENEFMTGCCDVNLPAAIVDVKCPWDKQTLQSNIYCMDSNYKWQGIGYMILYGKNKFILFYGLMDTDESVNYGEEVIYSTLPDNQRWIAYQIEYDAAALADLFEQIKARVILCRAWLDDYDTLVRGKMGQINIAA